MKILFVNSEHEVFGIVERRPTAAVLRALREHAVKFAPKAFDIELASTQPFDYGRPLRTGWYVLKKARNGVRKLGVFDPPEYAPLRGVYVHERFRLMTEMG